jgi:hypothetical protein
MPVTWSQDPLKRRRQYWRIRSYYRRRATSTRAAMPTRDTPLRPQRPSDSDRLHVVGDRIFLPATLTAIPALPMPLQFPQAIRATRNSAGTVNEHYSLEILTHGSVQTFTIAPHQATSLLSSMLPAMRDDTLRAEILKRNIPLSPEWEILGISGSSVIERVAYHGKEQTLVIQFKRAGSFGAPPAQFTKYVQVPRSVFAGFFTADSAGKYFNSEVKGKYPSIRAEEFIPNQPGI